VNSDNVESSHRCCALVIGLTRISERRLGHSQLCAHQLPPFFIAQLDGAHNHRLVGTPDQDVR
jgi:hypothetical protein